MLTMFNDTIVTIYPHSMLINLEPFPIFEPLETVYFAEERGKGRCDLLSF